ncbi:transglutaminase family protein [Sphingomonas sp.]|uniref:transglutaminase family protein n=1 Tax=Sphingomonas sp. TaxID=28214 RepID=UPI001B0AF249|nr:transglutaminase family protein [Sphingomonas sp.]MBO9714635.1 transglutaminase family protein [Sphingomonas sp.]
MRIAVEHKSQYRFTEPQSRIVQMLRLTPSDTIDQTVVSWMISVECDARLRDAVDGYGNAVTMLYAEGPIEEIEVSVSGEVLTLEASGVIRGADEPLPPLFYCRATPRTKPSTELADFAAGFGGDPLDRLHRLNAALFERFPQVPDKPDRGVSAAQAFRRKAITSREITQVFIAGARSLGVPARYVSGYRADSGSPCAPHGWAEAWVDGLGWVGFDPSAGLSPDERYVRVAVGLDSAGAAAIAGWRLGHGDEQLDVDLHVDDLGREE